MMKVFGRFVLAALMLGTCLAAFRLTDGEPSPDQTEDKSSISQLSAYAHRAAGVLVLLSGVVALASRKGRRPHRIAGRIYVVSVIALFVLIMPMLLAAPSGMHVLTILAVYLTVSGVIVAVRPNKPAKITDSGQDMKLGLQIAATFLLAAYCAGAMAAGKPDMPETGLAVTGLLLALCDSYRLCQADAFADPVARIRSHAVRMVGSLCVLLSANFYALTTDAMPLTLRWVIPAVGTAVTLFAVPHLFGVAARRTA
jgi:uncharacterized membrane protein